MGLDWTARINGPDDRWLVDTSLDDLEIYTLSAYGRALVCSGSFDVGFAYLDEAMAATMAGELKDHWLAADASCNMLIACDRVHDLARATRWCHVAEDWARRHHRVPFFAFCRISYGGLLYARGRWPEAEGALKTAETPERGSGGMPRPGTQC